VRYFCGSVALSEGRVRYNRPSDFSSKLRIKNAYLEDSLAMGDRAVDTIDEKHHLGLPDCVPEPPAVE
jgi:hypothetical protein